MRKHRKPFEIGNVLGKRRQLGTRTNCAHAACKLLEEFSVPLMKRCISSALQGDMKAMEILMQRLMPRGKLTANLTLQDRQTIQGIAEEYSMITGTLAKDGCPAAERQALANLVNARLETDRPERLRSTTAEVGKIAKEGCLRLAR